MRMHGGSYGWRPLRLRMDESIDRVSLSEFTSSIYPVYYAEGIADHQLWSDVIGAVGCPTMERPRVLNP